MNDKQMIKGAWAFAFMMIAAILGGFVLTAAVTLLGINALHTIEAAPARHVAMSIMLFGGTALLVACKQRIR